MATRVVDRHRDLASPPAVALAEGWRLVLGRWEAEALMSGQTRARMLEIGARFVARLTATGADTWVQVQPGDCRAFVTAPTRGGQPPRAATQHLRRATVRAVFRTLRELGLCTGDPTLDLRLPPREPRAYRPLTDDEVALCRASTRLGGGSRTQRRAAAWALGEATAATSEIGAVRVGDLDDPADPSRVRLAQSRRYLARDGQLSGWGRRILARQAAATTAGGGELLAYGGTGRPGAYLAQASVCTQLTRVLELAGLREDPAVCARSLRGWAGARLYAAGMPIEQVALRLGCRSLDAAAAEVGLTWSS